MDADKKKPIMIGIIVVCIGLAVAITVKTQSGEEGGLETVKRGQMIWILCTNADCEHSWEMDKKDFFQYLQEHQDPMSMAAPLVLCDNCGEESGVRAEKCKQCGHLFPRSSIPHDFADRCPECSYSDLEARRKAAREEAAAEE
jgi:hypothetical protein